jgi:YARHG domain
MSHNVREMFPRLYHQRSGSGILAQLIVGILAFLGGLSAAAESSFEGEKYPMTRTGLMSREDISNWSFGEVRYAINEMYARHGYDFPKKEIKSVFLKYRWYRNRLRPKRDVEEIEKEFNEYETENSRLLGQMREDLQAGRAGNRSADLSERKESALSSTESGSYTPPEIHAWIGVNYSYLPLGARDKDDEIKVTERENLPASQIVTRGSEIDRAIEGSATIAPVKCSIHLTRKSSADTGTLSVNVVDTASGRVVEEFPVSSKDAIEELRKRDSVQGSVGTDFVLNLPDSAKGRLAEDARKWVLRDEGQDRGKPKIRAVTLHIALGSPKS